MPTSTSLDASNTIHLALSPWDLTDDYNRHAGVTLLSFLDHCSRDTHVVVHLLYDAKLSIGKEQETEYNKSCYQKIAERYNCTIIFHPVELPEWIDDVPAVKNWTPGTLLRLCLPGLLPDVDKIIYVDCDMVITADMETLWKVPIGDKYLAAVPDSAVPNFGRKRRNYCKRKNIPLDGYFCAGTLVLNLQKLREGPEKFEDVVFGYLNENRDLPYLDQDILNWFCQGNYFPLEEKYNIYTARQDALQFIDDGILHYAAKGKPWKRYGGRIDNPYWKYLVQTPWAKDRDQLVRYVRGAPDISHCFSVLPEHYHYQDGLGYSAIAVKMMKLSLHLPVEIVKGFFLFVAARLRRIGVL